MQIFTPAQAKGASEERLAKDARRAQALADTTNDLLKANADAERLFEETMAKQREETEQWFAENVARKKALADEVERLEKRRKEALMPPLIKAEDIHSVSDALHARKLELDLQEQENEETSRLLMRRLDEVSERELDLNKREKQVKRMEHGAELQRDQVAQDAKRLSRQIAEFQEKVETTQADFAFKESELDARKNLYDQNDLLLVEREKEIEAGKRLLADQRLLLDKGFEELRKLKVKKSV